MRKMFLAYCVSIVVLSCTPNQKKSLQRKKVLADSIEQLKSNLNKLDKSEISIFMKHQDNIEEANKKLDSIRQVRKSWRIQLDTLQKEYKRLKQD